jgi:hypothetical protein
MLVQYSAQLPGSRVLDDSYQVNLAGIAENRGRLAYFAEFLDDMKRSGSLKRAIEKLGYAVSMWRCRSKNREPVRS